MNQKAIHSIICILAASLMFISCKTYRMPTAAIRGNYKPSVTMKTGNTITGNEVRERTPIIGKDKIQVDDTKYLAKDVAFYQTNKNRYANVGRSEFAYQTVEGKINMYAVQRKSTSSTYNSATGSFKTSTNIHYDYYLQKGGDLAKVVPYSHKMVRDYVSPFRPSMTLVEKSEQAKETSRILGWAGLGYFATSIGLIAASVSAPEGKGDAIGTVGGVMLFTSPFVLIPISIFKYKAQKYDFQAIEAYNGGKP